MLLTACLGFEKEIKMPLISTIVNRWQKYHFLFEELVKRDFKKKYKRTHLGLIWSMLGPLMQLAVMALVFTQFFGATTEHFVIYVFAGNLVFIYFKQATTNGMLSLTSNSGIISNVNAPKYLFLLSSNVATLINFLLTLIIFFMFTMIFGIGLHFRFLLILYPVICLLVFNIGVGLILSAMFVFFKDVQYLYDIFTIMLMWMSAIFYPIEGFSLTVQRLFMLNPIFVYIHYIRLVVIHGVVPSINVHLLGAFYALAVLAIGGLLYKKYNYRFLYYM